MREVLLIIVLIFTYALGYFLMSRLDCFLAETYKNTKNEVDRIEPSCIVLTEELSDNEIIEEIQRFRDKHNKMKIVLCDNMDVINETW